MGINELSLNEKAERAKFLLEDPMLKHVFESVMNESVQELLGSPVGSLTAQEAHATMKGIERLKARLRRYVDDLKMRK